MEEIEQRGEDSQLNGVIRSMGMDTWVIGGQTLQRAKDANWPSIMEGIVDIETDASMGASLDNTVEYEPLPELVSIGSL